MIRALQSLSVLGAALLALFTAVASAAPNVTATKDDNTAPGVRKVVGNNITYTITIGNSGPDPATGVLFTDPDPANTGFVSVNSTPIARNDTYSAIGNVQITIPVGSGVLVNDNDPDGVGPALTVSASPATTSGGGNVSVAANGSFTYNPAPGFTGADTFTYTISDGEGNNDTATVTINVTGLIWFINAAAGAGGDGRLTAPFNTIAAFNSTAADDPGDNIFLYSGTYSTGLTLLANQRLIGQGALTSLQTITGLTPPTGSLAFPATGGARPTIGVAGGTGVTLGSGNTVNGLNVTNSNGSGITGSAVGTLTLADFDVTVTGGSALSLTTSGTVTATGTDNDLNSTTGTALNVVNVTIGAAKLTFKSISAGNNTAAVDPVNGIFLDNTGTLGGLVVTGTAVADSGGTIQRTTGSGIVASNTQDLSLNRMRIDTIGSGGASQHGIYAPNLRGTCLVTNSTIIDWNSPTGNGIDVVNVNTNLTSLTVSGTTFNGTATNNDGVFMEAQGTSSMTLSVEGGCFFTDMFGDGVQVNGITGGTGTVRVTVKNSTFSNAAALGNGGISINPFGAVRFYANIDNNTFDTVLRPVTNLGAIGMTSGLTAVADITIQNNTLNNIIGARGITATIDGGITRMLIDNNNIDRLGSTSKFAISVNATNNAGAGTVGNVDVTIRNNDIGQAAALWTAGNGLAEAIFVTAQAGGSVDALIQSNIVDANGSLEIIRARASGTGVLNATFLNNDVNDTVGTHLELAGAAGTVSGQAGNLNLSFSGNIVPAGGVGTITITEGSSGGPVSTVNVQQASAAAVAAANSGATVNVSGAPAFGAAAPTLPTLPTLPLFFAPGGVEAKSGLAANVAGTNLPSASDASPRPNVSGTMREMAAGTPTLPGIVRALTQAQLNSVVSAALARWTATGLTGEQLATLRRLKFEVADLPGWYLGEAGGDRIRVDDTAGGHGWFVGAAAKDDALFANETSATRGYTWPTSPAAGRIDLLTAILHEMGHSLGLDDTYSEQDRDNLMYGFLTKGERRLPAKDQALGAVPKAEAHPHFLGTPLSIGDLPPGKTVTITYVVTITGAPTSITNQGTVSGSNFANVLTDDPTVAGAANPTVTPVELPPVVSNVAKGANEDVAAAFAAADFTPGSYSDPNGDALTTVRITSLPVNGVLKISGSTFTVPQDIAIANIGNLTYTSNLNYNGADSFGWNGSDGTLFAVSGATVNVTVAAVNDKPTFTAANPPTVNEDAGAQTVVGWANFNAGAVNESGQTVLAYTVSSVSNAALFSAGPSIATNGTLTYTPVANANGTSTFQVRVQDNGGTALGGIDLSDPQTFTITVNAVNDAPVITGQAALSTAFNTARSIALADLTVTDVDNSYPTGFTLSILDGTNYTRVGNTITPALNFVGTLSVPAKVNDGAADSNTFNLVVTVNPDPLAAQIGSSIAPEPGGGYRISFLGNPGQTYTIQFTPSLTPVNWQFLGTRTADANGRYSIVDNPPPGTLVRFYRSIFP